MNISIQLPALSALVLVVAGVVFGAGFSYGHSARVADGRPVEQRVQLEQGQPTCLSKSPQSSQK